MLSRVADAIYWMSRYVERAENVARFADVSLNLALDMPSGAPEPWAALVAVTGDDAFFARAYGEPTRENVLRFLTFDREYPSSVLSCLRAARENARTVREIISSEMWEQVNKAYLLVREASSLSSCLEAPHEFLAAVKEASHLFVGTTYLPLPLDGRQHQMCIGQSFERADKTSRILDVKDFVPGPAGSGYEELAWSALLKSASALEMYRKRHGVIVPARVLEFLVLDRRFPRSLRYCISKAERSLQAIVGATLEGRESKAERALGRLRAELEFATVDDVLARGLHAYMDAMQEKLNEVGEAVWATFVAVQPEDDEAPRSAAAQ